jgi:esterase
MLAYFEYGSGGSPVLLLHGLLGSKASMTAAAKVLSENHRVYVPDLRNHGESFHHSTMNYPEMANDLVHFMDSHGIRQSSVVGHSMGGKCAIQLAISHPERVDKLVVIDISPKAYSNPSWFSYVTAMSELDLSRIRSRKQADEMLSPQIPAAVYRQFLLSNLTFSEDVGYTWKANLQAIARARDDLCSAIYLPMTYPGETLIVRGENSNYIRNEDISLLQQFFSSYKLVTIAGAGHLLHIETKDLFHQVLVEFIMGNE